MYMKKIASLFLTICLLGSLCACGNNASSTPETTLAPAVKTNVAKPLTWADIDAIPIANNDMSEEELRQLCLDFMDMMMTFTWTPSEQVDMINTEKDPEKVVKTFYPDKVYGGTPYLTSRCGNLYTAMEFYDERNGMLDLSGGMDTLNLFGNQCSSSTFWAWSRVCASAEHTSTATINETYGCLRVGPYTYDETIGQDPNGYYVEGCGTDIICAQNGMQTMFESYALVKPADGIVSSTQAHVQMIAGTPNVVRDAAGNIDGRQSTVAYTDQDGQYYPATQVDGTAYEHVGGNKIVVSFADLYMKHYIPFTFAELNKTKPVEKSEIKMSCTGEAINLAQLSAATVTCNYSISDLTIVVKDENGKQVYRKLTPMYYGDSVKQKNVNVSKAANAFELTEFADGKHTIEISARIGTGEKPVIYTGILQK